MIKRVSVRNFQSWKKLDLDLAPITMLVGKGNSGKSALLRAVTAALTNAGGEDFIRHGANQAKVLLEFEDGHSLLWTKPRGKGATYHIEDGEGGVEEHTKTGQSVPVEIQEKFGFRPVEIDKAFDLWPQFKGPFDPPFLVFESGSRVARALGKLTRLDVFVQAQLNARREMDREQSEARVALEEADRRQQELDRLPDLDELRGKYDELRGIYERAEEKLATVTAGGEAIQAYRQASHSVPRGFFAKLDSKIQDTAEAISSGLSVQGLVREYRQYVSDLADSGCALDDAVERVAELTQEYHQACLEKGVCDTCPWK